MSPPLLRVALATLAALALRPAAAAGAALPERAAARYRVELAGQVLGFARLTIACGPDLCQAAWESALRAPAEAGGGAVTRRIALESDRAGVARAVRVEAAADGETRRVEGRPGAVPATLAEVLLAAAAEGERRCLAVRDEESGVEGEACARRQGAWLAGEVLGEPVRFRADPGAAPDEVVLPAMRMRFLRDPAAALPGRAPSLYGVEVARPADAARSLCGRRPEPPSPAAPAAVPRAFPAGASCRERTARYLAEVARAGLRGREVVGVADDGRALVWHAWAEVEVGGAWVPVDPSFEQAPARGPRWAVARFALDDPAARAAAGRAVLACWGAGR